MNEQNYDYLKDQLKYTGFGDQLNEKLREAMLSGKNEFSLFHQQTYGRDTVVATLQFKKSDSDDRYFFNRYSVLVKNNLHPDAAKQTFYLNRNEDNVTLKEAYNLMSGRAVFKELTNKEQEKYNAWIQLDFKSKGENENFAMRKFNETYFKLEDVLAKYPIREMLAPDTRDQMIRSLQRGNMQMMTVGEGEKARQLFVEVAPQFKTLNFYDASMRRVQRETLQAATGENKSVVNEPGARKDQKESLSAADEEGPAGPKKKRERKVKIS